MPYTLKLSLFFIAYMPLLVIYFIKGLQEGLIYLNWGGWNYNSLIIFIRYILFPIVILTFILWGIIGIICFSISIHNKKKEGEISKTKVLSISNKNSDSITYMITYIIPFSAISYEGICNKIYILIYFFIVMMIYIKSKLIVINPILNIKYNLYEVELELSDSNKKYYLVVDGDEIDEGEEIEIIKIESGIYYCSIEEENDESE
jgi:hypothetical protein